jgi:hypothetical protein
VELIRKKLDFLKWLVLGVYGFLCVFGGVSAYWIGIDTDSPITMGPMEWLDRDGRPLVVAHPGDTVYVHRSDVCVRKSIATLNVTRALVNHLVDNIVYIAPSGVTLLSRGCRDVRYAVYLSRDMIPGIYDYVLTIQYSNNPMQSAMYVVSDATLEVTP